MRAAFSAAEAEIGNTFSVNLNEFLSKGLDKPKVAVNEARNVIVHLLRRSFEHKLLKIGLKPYELANKANYFWFPAEVIAPRKQVPIQRPNQTKGARALVGAKTLKNKDGTPLGTQGWHFGVEVIPMTWPFFGFYIRSHVAFTLDGNPYLDVAKQHRLRRRECKLWFNDRWADMLLAAMAHLGKGENIIHIPVSNSVEYLVSTLPDCLVSSVTFSWAKDKDLPAYEPDSEAPTTEITVESDDEDEEEEADE